MNFGVGDIVRKKHEVITEYFIVILPSDETKGNTCVLKRIFPLEPLMKKVEVHKGNLRLVAYNGTIDQTNILTVILKKRMEFGWNNNETIEKHMRVGAKKVKKRNELHNSKIQSEKESSLINNRIKYNQSDVVEYNKAMTIDECLDMINHLNDLIKNFSDDKEEVAKFRKSKLVVKRRLKRLIEIENRKQ